MAKKARKKGETEEEEFEFPEFDEAGFLRHEFEQYYATLLAFGFSLVIGCVAFVAGRAGLTPWGDFGIGVAGIVASVFAIRAVRPSSDEYTKGDWAGLIALMFFGFLGLWFVLANLL